MVILKRTAMRLAGPAVLASVLAACGGGSDDPAVSAAEAEQAAVTSRGSFDPCVLLSAAEVEAAVGWKPATIQPTTNGDLGSCNYRSANTDPMLLPPEELKVGVWPCPTNMTCTDLPKFGSSQELAQYRKKGYEETTAWGNLDPKITPVDGMGVAAIEHNLAGLIAIEMSIGKGRLAFVQTWSPSTAARGMAEKVLARVQ